MSHGLKSWLKWAAKWPVLWLACLCFALTASPAAQAEELVRATLNGTEIRGAFLSDEGRVMVPMRPFFEAIGADIFWDDSSQTVRVFIMGSNITLRAGGSVASRNGAQVLLDAPPRILRDRMFVPLRFVSESIGGQVAWDPANRLAEVTLKDANGAPVRLLGSPSEQSSNPSGDAKDGLPEGYTEEDVNLLAKIINAEAYSEPYEGKVAVGAVVVNRLKTGRYGSTIKDVIYAGCQFTVVCNGAADKLAVREDSLRAAMEALKGADPTGGALYFTNLRTTPNASFWKRLTKTATIGRHTFFR